MFRPGAAAGTTMEEAIMGADPHDTDDERGDDDGTDDDGVDEASEESFPASDPPSYGSRETG
jgi:hypothetical protein